MKKYLPILAAFVVVVVLLIIGMSSCNSGAPETEAPDEDIPTLSDDATEKVSIYYKDAENYLVPIERELPADGNVAQSAVDLLCDTSENWSDAGMLGVMPTLPEGAGATVTLSGSIASVDLTNFVAESGAAEALAVESLTATLLNMDAIDVVRYTTDGTASAMLPFGTAIGDAVASVSVNPEEGAVNVSATGETASLALAFCNADGLLAPVTRVAEGVATLESAMSALFAGPAEGSVLSSAIPEGCALTGVAFTDDTAYVDLSAAFGQASAQDQQAAAKAIVYTAMQFDDVLDVVIRVDGEALGEDIVGETLPVALNTASDQLSTLETIGNSTNEAIENDYMPAANPTTSTGTGLDTSPRVTTPTTTLSPTMSVSPSPSPTSVNK